MVKRRMLVFALASFVACAERATEPPPDGGEDPLTAVALQPDRDNTLFEESGQLSNGAGQFIFVGVTNQPQIRRALLHFDVAGSSIPPGPTIDSAKLALHMSRTAGGSVSVSLHSLTAAWGEAASDAPGAEGTGTAAAPGDATWIHAFFDSSPWTVAGGDYVASAIATTAVQSAGFYTWGSTAGMVADIQDWLDNPSANFGWIVIGDESTPVTAKRFDSRQHDVVENRPILRIFYTRP